MLPWVHCVAGCPGVWVRIGVWVPVTVSIAWRALWGAGVGAGGGERLGGGLAVTLLGDDRRCLVGWLRSAKIPPLHDCVQSSGRSAAWLAHVPWEHEVAGSNPVAPTTSNLAGRSSSVTQPVLVRLRSLP